MQRKIPHGTYMYTGSPTTSVKYLLLLLNITSFLYFCLTFYMFFWRMLHSCKQNNFSFIEYPFNSYYTGRPHAILLHNLVYYFLYKSLFFYVSLRQEAHIWLYFFAFFRSSGERFFLRHNRCSVFLFVLSFNMQSHFFAVLSICLYLIDFILFIDFLFL